VVKKERGHDFCCECGTDLGEIPPPPPCCKKCRRPVKGHQGQWGMNRCKAEPFVIDMDSFFKQTINAYGVALDKMMTEDHSCTLATLGGKR
jgi:predicted amidophosphoribosyltransferase